MKLVRHHRPEEALADTIKPVMRGNRDSQRATGTEKAQTAATVLEMGSAVTDALEQAQQAIEDAADALTTSSGKNARRRGHTEPAPPPGGWAEGDQWIVDNADGVPVEVRVWDGVGFVPEQLLAAELLVLSGGLIRLADGVVTADAIAADAIDGMTITGALIRTAASGQRMEFDSAGLKSYSATDVLTSVLSAYDGNFSLSSISDSSRLLLSPAALWLQEGEVNRLAFNKFGLQVYPTPGLTAQYMSDRAYIERQVTHAITGAATGKVQMLEMSDGLSSIAATLETASPSVRDASASLTAYFDGSGIPRSRAQADVVSVKEISTFTDGSDPAGPVNVTATSGLAVNGKLVAGDALRGTATKMNDLHTGGFAYDGLRFWRTDQLCYYVYVGGEWHRQIPPKGDRAWARIDSTAAGTAIGYLGSGVGHYVATPYDGIKARIKNGVLYISGGVTRTGGFPANHVLFTLNSGFRPAAAAVQYAYAGGDNFVLASQVDGSIVVALTTSSPIMYLGLTIPLD